MAERTQDSPQEALDPSPTQTTVLMDRYALERVVARGSLATLYAGTDRMLDRPVAIKVLDALIDEEGAGFERFEREAKAAAKIAHPNVVSIFDRGVVPATGQPFIVMELLEGRDLGQELALHGPLSPDRALALLRKALDALASGHKQGIVHKDLKPPNLFLTSPRTPEEDMRLLDFGTASLDVIGARTTTPGPVSGQPEYLAPEFIADKTVSPALDVYQMALIFIEMLTGKPAVRGKTPLASVPMHEKGQIAVPRPLFDGLLGTILLKALALDHNARYPDARAFLLALKPIEAKDIPALTGAEKPIFVCDQLALVDGVLSETDMVTQEMMASTRPSNPAKWVFLGSLGTVLLVVALFGGLKALFPPETPKADEATSTPPSASPEAQPEAPAAPEAPSLPTVAKTAPPVQVLLVTKPSGAQVFKDDEALGLAPLNIVFESDDETPVSLTLRYRGYRNARVDISPADGLKQEIVLKRARPPLPTKTKEPNNTMGLAD